tara:strand:+ start:2330 stop:2572 length:243 start_codon:yes stop_codon:yes gene_type:complete
MQDNPSLYLYHTQGCHLCDQAQDMLDQLQVRYLLRDIFPDPVLMEQYGTRIPVLYCNATQRTLGWPFTPQALILFLESDA